MSRSRGERGSVERMQKFISRGRDTRMITRIRSRQSAKGALLRILLVLVAVLLLKNIYGPAKAIGFESNQTIPGAENDSYTAEVTSDPAIKEIRFPANALNYDKTSTIITQAAVGLRWQRNSDNGAFLIVPRPEDWDGASDVEMRLHFLTISSTSGEVQFSIRPRAFDPGDIFANADTLSDAAVPVSHDGQIGEQVITIPASRFGTKNLWVITIQRPGAQDTYADDVILMSVDLRYAPAPKTIFLPLIIR